MRRRQVVAPLLKSAPVAAALAFTPAVQAASVQTVFSAENALYGAGYQVGQADGWIDDSLRAAIRQYQSDRTDLNASGELDSATLAALGISANASQLLADNAVASRAEALSELGLSEARYQRSSFAAAPTPEPQPEPQPKQQPEPAPKPVVVAKAEANPEPAPATEPEAEVKQETAKPAPEPQPVKQADTVASEPQVASSSSVEIPQPAPAVTTPEPEPTSEPVQVRSSFGFGESETIGGEPEAEGPPPITVATNDEAKPVERVKNGTHSEEDVQSILPQEPTAAGVTADSTPAQNAASEESKGNVLTRVFDFLFGWMV